MSFTFDFKKLLENELRFVTDLVLEYFAYAGSVTRIAFKYKLTGFRINFFKNDFSVYHRLECRDTSGTFTPFLARTFESSLAKVHKITKKVGQNRSAPLGSFNFTGKRLSLLVSVHMAFVERMLIKQMRLFLGV